eukprot:284817681_4
MEVFPTLKTSRRIIATGQSLHRPSRMPPSGRTTKSIECTPAVAAQSIVCLDSGSIQVGLCDFIQWRWNKRASFSVLVLLEILWLAIDSITFLRFLADRPPAAVEALDTPCLPLAVCAQFSLHCNSRPRGALLLLGYI